MKSLCALFVVSVTGLAIASSVGTAPRQEAARYPAHAENEQVSLGAVRLGLQQVRKAFTSDLNRCCVVVEMAVYPAKDHHAEVSLANFTLREVASDKAVKPSSATVVASSLQHKAASDRDVTISPQTSIGYESGTYTDPYTGQRQRTGGVYTSTGVGVGIGSSGPRPGSTQADRKAMETELTEKGLPEGKVETPVAGYLYFPVAKKKGVKYQLEYLADGKKIVLNLAQ